jgi:phospholipase D1/2
MVTRFATTLRRKLFRGRTHGPFTDIPTSSSRQPFILEHLGLIEPQICANGLITSAMRPAPFPSENELGIREDSAVADPLSDHFQGLWIGTAQKNRAIFSEMFKTLPNDIVRNWEQYKV